MICSGVPRPTAVRRLKPGTIPAKKSKVVVPLVSLNEVSAKFRYISVVLVPCCTAYCVYLSFLPIEWIAYGNDEIFAVVSVLFGLFIGCYSSFYMSNWWSIRLATGSVAGALADTVMVLSGYLYQLEESEVPLEAISSIASNLKAAYMYHLVEVKAFGADTLRMLIKPKGKNLIDTLSIILGEITILSENVSFSDSVKFSLLPSVQSNLSTVRSGSGDCTMILATHYPRSLRNIVFCAVFGYMLYLPIYLSRKAELLLVNLVSLAAFVVVVGFLVLVETEFKKPFTYNSFHISKIMHATFDIIDTL